MKARERIVKAINHEEPDRVPSYEGGIDNLKILKHYGEQYGIDGVAGIQEVFFNQSNGDEDVFNEKMHNLSKSDESAKIVVEPTIRLYSKIGLDLVPISLCILPYRYLRNGYISEFGHRFEYKENPSDKMHLLYYMGGNIENFAEYEEFPLPDPDHPLRENFFKAAMQLEKEYNGKVCCAPGITGMMEMTWEGFGLENFSRLLINRKNTKKVFDDRGKFSVEMVKRIIEWGGSGPILIFDDYGYKKGLFMSPRNYREFVIPWLEKICKTAHKGGLQVVLHSCGDIYQLFEDIINAGVDAINPIEPTTANSDYDIFKLHEKYGDKISFVGNVSPQDLSDKEPQVIEDYTKKLIKNVAPGGGFVLSSGHSINPSVKLDNFLAMRETLNKFGKYPITV
ncbi:MAG: uroporphyrinogen decarboxylase family protein [Promethearchaeota archaeon]|jgi:uroporphyrinogen decarboxylase